MNRKFSTVNLKQVSLKDAYCVNALEKEIAYLLEFDADRLLAGFRETAGIDMHGAVRYKGWESYLIGGHTLGHYLTACAQGYAGGNITDAQRDGLYKMMTTLNKSARDAMVKYNVHSCTDVTGFGLIGHSYEMAQGSDTEITLNVDAIDLIPEALELARMGILPAGMYRNRRFAQKAVDAGDIELAKQDLLYDPQTAGGLMIAVAPEDADALFEELKTTVPSAQRIGTVAEYQGGARIKLR